jgi:hypothetical protein
MIDMSKTIAPKSDQLNADDLIGGPITVKITDVKLDYSNKAQPASISFDGDDGRPFKPCLSMRRILVHVWGSDGANYVGKSMTLFRDPNAKYGGVSVGGVRISHVSDIKSAMTFVVTESRNSRKPYTVKPIDAARVADPQPEKPAAPSVDVLSLARAAASKGRDTFATWWKENPDYRGEASKIMDELKELAAKADTPPAFDEEEIPM